MAFEPSRASALRAADWVLSVSRFSRDQIVEHPLAGMAEWRMTQVVTQPDGVTPVAHEDKTSTAALAGKPTDRKEVMRDRNSADSAGRCADRPPIPRVLCQAP